MKLVCPPEDWQNAREMTEAELNLTKFIAKQLDVPLKVDEATNKAYLGESKAESKAQSGTAKKGDNVLRFVMCLPKSPVYHIIDGVITLNGKMYKACSGCIGGQVFGDYWTVGASPIPPGNAYEVDLNWTPSSLPGIAGRYYHILPDPIVRSDGKARRTEIGLHQDNATAGTSGCIGVVGQDWDTLKAELDALAKSAGKLRLEVYYKCQD